MSAPAVNAVFRKIRMELARTHQHPSGAPDHAFTLVAPLRQDGLLDADAWSEQSALCRATYHDAHKAHRHGVLRYRPPRDGSLPQWGVVFDDGDVAEGFRFEIERFVPGEYISIALPGEDPLAYRVTSVVPLTQPSPQRSHL